MARLEELVEKVGALTEARRAVGKAEQIVKAAKAAQVKAEDFLARIRKAIEEKTAACAAAKSIADKATALEGCLPAGRRNLPQKADPGKLPPGIGQGPKFL